MGIEWEGLNLGEFFEAAKEPTTNLAHDLADEGAQALVARVKENTPIERFAKQIATYENGAYRRTEAPGHLRESISKVEMRVYVQSDDKVYETGAETDVFYAPHVEEGTGLWGDKHREYVIRPKKPGGWLSWITQTGFTRKDGSFVAPGTRVFAKEVHHPGSPGQHMFAIGAAMLEHEIEAGLFDRRMDSWVREVESL